MSRIKNANIGFTGLLLYRNGSFVQTIEGESNVVQDLYDSICNDERHCDVTTLISEEISVRKFPDWTMDFRDLNIFSVDLPPGFSSLMNERWNISIRHCDSSKLHAFVDMFVK